MVFSSGVIFGSVCRRFPGGARHIKTRAEFTGGFLRAVIDGCGGAS
jgi:hypothetical protein